MRAMLDEPRTLARIAAGGAQRSRAPYRVQGGALLRSLALLCAGACEDTALVPGAHLVVEPQEIDFGRVPTGETRSQELHLKNLSPSAALEIARIALAEGSARAFSLAQVPSTLLAGEEAIVIVRYTADDAEPDRGHVEIESNAIEGAIVRVPVRSARTVPRIGVDPLFVDLGSITTGSQVSRPIRITSRGDATLSVSRVSLRTEGFAGEACARNEDCREGVCTSSSTGFICALPCDAEGEASCRAGFSCTTGEDGVRACREGDGSLGPPTAARGFRISAARLPSLPDLLPRAETEVLVTYAPGDTDRGRAELVLESNDPEQPVTIVPLAGRPENLPPVAVAALDGAPPDPIEPGSRIALEAAASYDPEGSPLTFEWRFLLRPEGSRAGFEDARAIRTAFRTDLPGEYIVHLRARDETGLTSTNDARIELSAGAGTRVRVVLQWNREEADLDLHLVSPGMAVGSVGDCFFENPTPDWGPLGARGDPVLTATTSLESIAIADPGTGVYTLLVRVIAPSPRGPTEATLMIYLNDVEAAIFDASLPSAMEQWDVATLSWPSGRLTQLGTIR